MRGFNSHTRHVAMALFLGALIPVGTAGAATDMPLLIRSAPVAQASGAVPLRARVEAVTRSEVLRTGQVILDVDTLPLADEVPVTAEGAAARRVAPAARRLALELFPDTYAEVETTAIEQPRAGTLAMRGRVLGDAAAPELSTFSLTVGPKAYLMSYQDLDTGRLYRVVGDRQNGVGMVTEIDPSRAPSRLPSTPLMPPLN